MENRCGEEVKSHFRTDRFLQVNNHWYFITRELTQEGPFDNKTEAENELNLYLRHANDEFMNQSDP